MKSSLKTTKVLMIGFVWPEVRSSAAGLRTAGLIRIFKRAGWEVGFVSPAVENEHSRDLAAQGVTTASIPANDARFDEFVREFAPDFVVFDRFVMEEQFGWRVLDQCPAAVRILDTIDLHFLRRVRGRALEAGYSLSQILEVGADVMALSEGDFERELAAIYRCDLSWVVSDFELRLLNERFGVPIERLALSRIFYPSVPVFNHFEMRKDFVHIGNFRHPPNKDAVLWLHQTLWPLIRRQIPEAELHIYGAYPPKDIMALDDAKSGFRVKGWANDQFETLAKYRVNLAPLRFGAGIKGKVLDGWWVGTPVVASAIAAEGMASGLPWGGVIADSVEDFVAAAVLHYGHVPTWELAQTRGRSILETHYLEARVTTSLPEGLLRLQTELVANRARNSIGQMLWHHQLQSTKYFSLWIEEKNKRARSS